MSGLGFGAESPLTWAYRHTKSLTHADDRLPRPPTKVIQNSDCRTRPHFTSKFKLGLGACAVGSRCHCHPFYMLSQLPVGSTRRTVCLINTAPLTHPFSEFQFQSL